MSDSNANGAGATGSQPTAEDVARLQRALDAERNEHKAAREALRTLQTQHAAAISERDALNKRVTEAEPALAKLKTFERRESVANATKAAIEKLTKDGQLSVDADRARAVIAELEGIIPEAELAAKIEAVVSRLASPVAAPNAGANASVPSTQPNTQPAPAVPPGTIPPGFNAPPGQRGPLTYEEASRMSLDEYAAARKAGAIR